MINTMALIFTDFPTGSVHCWKSVNIKGIPKLTGKVPMYLDSP